MTLITRHNIETLRHFNSPADADVGFEVGNYVISVIRQFPWYIGIPIKLYATLVGLFLMLSTFGRLGYMSASRSMILARFFRFVPFFAIFSKLIRAVAFLNLFDHESVARTIDDETVLILDE